MIEHTYSTKPSGFRLVHEWTARRHQDWAPSTFRLYEEADGKLVCVELGNGLNWHKVRFTAHLLEQIRNLKDAIADAGK